MLLPMRYLAVNNGKTLVSKRLKELAHPARFELTTSAFGGPQAPHQNGQSYQLFS